jgi:hypothetical protein
MPIDNISVDFINQIDNIDLSFDNSIDNISIDFDQQIDNILINVGGVFQNVFSVNGILGIVELTASATLGSVTPSSGVYEYTFNHNLGYLYPLISIYNVSSQIVLSDIMIVDSNTATIQSLIDMNGYKVVAQR